MDDTEDTHDTTIAPAAPARFKRCNAKPDPAGVASLGAVCLKPKGHTGDHMGAREVPWSDDAAAAAPAKRTPRKLPIAPAAPPPVFETSYEPALPITSIRPSPTNPRKRFDDLEDLAASIRIQGVISPVQVRPRPKPDGTLYELIFGERRWRASQLAGLTTIKAEVVDLPDELVLERQIIENLQRHDVDPLDEAFGFRQLMAAGRDVDYIADKCGKSRSWIYSRLKLCDLPTSVQDQLAGGKLLPSVALLIGRIPDPELQVQATREVLRLDAFEVERELEQAGVEVDPNDEHIRRLEEIGDNAPQVGGDEAGLKRENVPMAVREAAEHIQRHYMTRLEHAPFDLEDETLSPGACTKCVYRTGTQPALFADVNRPDVCTNPPCFTAKKRAAFERDAAARAGEGVKVLSEDEAGKVFHSYHPTQVGHSSPYVKLDQQVPRELLPANVASATWGKLLGKKSKEVPKVLAQDAAGGAHELIDKSAAVKVLREEGKLPTPAEKKAAGRGGGSSGQDWKLDQAKREAKRKVLERAVVLAIADVPAKVAKLKPLALWKLLATTLGERAAGGDGSEFVLELAGHNGPKDKMRRADIDGAVTALVAKALKAGPDALAALVAQFLVADLAYVYGGELEKDGQVVLAALGVDWKAHRAVAEAEAKKAAASPIKWNGLTGKSKSGKVYTVKQDKYGWKYSSNTSGGGPFKTEAEAKDAAGNAADREPSARPRAKKGGRK